MVYVVRFRGENARFDTEKSALGFAKQCVAFWCKDPCYEGLKTKQLFRECLKDHFFGDICSIYEVYESDNPTYLISLYPYKLNSSITWTRIYQRKIIKMENFWDELLKLLDYYNVPFDYGCYYDIDENIIGEWIHVYEGTIDR